MLKHICLSQLLMYVSAHDATEMVAQLRAHHFKSQNMEGKEDLKNSGLNLVDGTIRGTYIHLYV